MYLYPVRSIIHHSIIALYLGFAFILLHSCSSDIVYEKGIDISGSSWKSSDILTFSAEMEDVQQPFTINYMIKTGDLYPNCNLWLFTTIVSPDSINLFDTVEIFLADEEGRWLGGPCGQGHEFTYAYKHNVRFPVSGTYTFRIEQAMRKLNLPAIERVTLQIKKFELKKGN